MEEGLASVGRTNSSHPHKMQSREWRYCTFKSKYSRFDGLQTRLSVQQLGEQTSLWPIHRKMKMWFSYAVTTNSQQEAPPFNVLTRMTAQHKASFFFLLNI